MRDPQMLVQVASLGLGAVLLLKPFSLAELYAALQTALLGTPLIRYDVEAPL
jgi:hypothetical protein